MAIYLKGLAIRGYRGIGPEIQELAPFRRFNSFIGANNVGKSAVLTFIADWLVLGSTFQASTPTFGRESEKAFGPLDIYRGGTETTVKAAIATDLAHFKNVAITNEPKFKSFYQQELIEHIFRSFSSGQGLVWFDLNLQQRGPLKLSYPLNSEALKDVDSHSWQALWQHLNPQSYGGGQQTWVSDVCATILSAQNVAYPQPILIPAIRQIGPKGEDLKDHSGRGLIDRLAELQNPSLDTRGDRLLFEKINEFLRTVADDADAKIEIPHNREHILVHMDGRVLPLDSLGTGIHEVIMIAAFCTINDKKIVCIEEPEIHLHPLLQRKLVSYLRANTDNQYFIATHSAAFIDTPESAIFHVTKDDQQSKFTESILRRDRVSICTNLGYRASDILQSNAVIWVEGPSDRLYLRWWIAGLALDLVEGIHYSIMFYGGRLLSHLSADDEEVSEFIDLRAINQNLAIVIDSDRKVAKAKINDTKRRVISEFDKSPGVAWLTKGREIENYIDHQLLQTAVQHVYSSSYIRAAEGGQYDHPLCFFKSTKGSKEGELFSDVDKVKVARKVTESEPDFSVLDLRTAVQSLTTLIVNANS